MPGPFDRVAERLHPFDVDVVPAVEGGLAHLPPELARGESLPAPAPLVVAQVPLPQVDDLAERADPGYLAEQSFYERGATSSQSTQK
ncbi:hypothetical protein Are01nite_31960 [Actinoplanes regularis]|nr:hypothetical protein Are01nite_31960 [Actinoplanes regularis]